MLSFRSHTLAGSSAWHLMAEELSEDPGHWGILKRKVEERRVSNTHQLRDVVVEEDNQETPG